MQHLDDLLSLRQHLRNAVASLRAMVLDEPGHTPHATPCLLRSLTEGVRQAERFDSLNKDPDLQTVWEHFKARLDRFREAADTSHDLLERWQVLDTPESFQAAAAYMAESLFPAHDAALGLLNHLITAVAFDQVPTPHLLPTLAWDTPAWSTPCPDAV